MTTSNNLIGNTGVGGNAGFQIETSGTTDPYEVVTKAIVVEEDTQEAKLLIATSRTPSASSSEGTMAIDVFPLPGRPMVKELATFTPVAATASTATLIQAATVLDTIYAGSPMTPVTLGVSGGTPPYLWYSNNLPPGITLDIDGTLHGTPMILGSFPLNISVSDSSTPSFIETSIITLNIGSDLALDLSNIQNTPAVVGAYYNASATPSKGVPPYYWSSQGSLPIGLSVTGEGQIIGYPCTYNSTTDFQTPFYFTLTLTDSLGAQVSASSTISITPAPLTIGQMNQASTFIGEPEFVTLPVYGGHSPYTMSGVSSTFEQTPVFISPVAITLP